MASQSSASSSSVSSTVPQDIVAIFHASFHPTKGNVVDWCLKVDDNLDLNGVEFSSLPSGLHTVEHDVVYFNHHGHTGLSLYRRRPTTEHGHRGFRLSSLGILLSTSAHDKPRPWTHLDALKKLASTIYDEIDMRSNSQSDLLSGDGDSVIRNAEEEVWEPARAFFEERKAKRKGKKETRRVKERRWAGWDAEFSDPSSTSHHPTLHLAHLLRILGPSSLTLYKHVLGRRRILIYTQPPVEAACVLCQVAADMCFDDQLDREAEVTRQNSRRASYQRDLVDMMDDQNATGEGSESRQGRNGVQDETEADANADQDMSDLYGRKGRLGGKHKQGIAVLGMVTLHDIDRLRKLDEDEPGRGWIACTTDAIFHEKAQLYDLIIDLAPPSSTPSGSPYAPTPSPSSSSPPIYRPARPISYVSRPVVSVPPTSDAASSYSSSNVYKLSAVRFTWSDVRLWQELDRILALDSSYPHSHSHSHHHPPMPDCAGESGWSDAWKLYEDVCLVCAGLWMGMGAWKDSPLRIELEGDDEINVNSGAGAAVQDDSDEEVEGGATAPGVGGSVVRELGNGIEGRPQVSGSSIMPGGLPEGPSVLGIGMVKVGKRSKGMRRTSGMSIFGRDKDKERKAGVTSCSAGSEGPVVAKKDGPERGRDQDREILTTLALLQTFHANTALLLSKLATFVPPGSRVAPPPGSFNAPLGRRASKRGRQASGDDGRLSGSDGRRKDRGIKNENTIVLTPKDMSSFELGPLSGLDAKFVEWLGEEYVADGTQVVVKKGWKEVLGFVFGF